MNQSGLGSMFRRYGQPVRRTGRGGQSAEGWAFVRPITGRGEGDLQVRPTPLGTRRGDRFLYLGEADLPLAAGDRVECMGTCCRVQYAQPIRVGEEISHWWAILRPQEVTA